MADLIDKQAAIGGLITGAAIMDGRHNMNFIDGLKFCINRLSAMPSAQPEIIRCKDCKHYYYADNRIPQEQRYSCDLDGDRWKPEDFCSYAERRPDDSISD